MIYYGLNLIGYSINWEYKILIKNNKNGENKIYINKKRLWTL